jgi:hypothetical protein
MLKMRGARAAGRNENGRAEAEILWHRLAHSIASTPRIRRETIAAWGVGDCQWATCACAGTAAARPRTATTRTAARRRAARSSASRRARRRTGVAAIRRVLGAELACRGPSRLGGCRRRRE